MEEKFLECNAYHVHCSTAGWMTGKYEVLAIRAGEGNGWTFSEAVLQESLPLWEGIPCFIDHAWGDRSLRDLAGTFHNPRWSSEHRGILLSLQPLGPSAALLQELGEQLIGRNNPNIGFSADLLFTASDHRVTKIVKVLELDLVLNPALGGTFIRTLNSQLGGKPMNEPIQSHLAEARLQPSKEDGLQPSKEDQSQANAGEGEAMRQVRLQMCQYLLESELNACGLPAPMQEHLRNRFSERVFEPQELSGAIEEARRLVSALLGSTTVRGPQVSAMFSTEDQLQAAVDDLLEAPRQKGCESLRVHRLSGIKELYMMLTGDHNLYGGYYPERVHLATTANFTGLVKNALNKVIANQWEQLGAAGYDWWQRVTLQEHFESLNTVSGTLVGTVGALPAIAEGGEYTELKVGDSPETADFTKYGGYIPLTLELIDRDDTRKLRLFPRELAKAGMRKISALVAAVFTDNNGVGPLMADGGYLFNATATTTAGGHANLLTGALSASQWDAVCTAVYNQPMLIANAAGYYGSGPALAINPRYLLVPRALELTAKKILYPYWTYDADIHAENLQRGAAGDVVVVPEWTDANNWAAAVDPNLVPGIIVCERFGILPEVFIAGDELSAAVFMNDEHRIKVRHFIAVLVQDWRPLHKSNVA